jgi:hypothetical protein
MIKCLFIRRKLYGYLCREFAEAEHKKIKQHLDACPVCRKRLEGIRELINLAQMRKTPEVSEGFWHDFKTDLDRKLNARLIPEFKLSPGLSYKLRPALVYASVLLIILGLWTYRFGAYTKRVNVAQSAEELVNEINLNDELSLEPGLNHDEDAYMDEFNLLIQLGESPA